LRLASGAVFYWNFMPEKTESSTESGKTKILIVEDNDFVRTQIVRFLADEGHEIVEAADGRQALDKVKSDKTIGLAIVDVRMEPIDGFEFVRTARGLGIETPVILVTGDQNPDLLSEANKWGVSAVLMKPVQKDRLVKTVQRIIQGRARAS
jgi:CheY-like chemotaxis protein